MDIQRRGPTRLPRVVGTSADDLLLLDTRKPKEGWTFERLTTAGARSQAVDARAALAGRRDLLGESDAPDALSWPESLDRAARRAAYVFGHDLFLLDLAAERVTRTREKESPPRTDLLAGLDIQLPELLTVPAAEGMPLYARILRPKGFDPARRYPVILDVYGGPGAPTVLDAWHGSVWFNQLLLRDGYVVASIDTRSATARSRAHETSVARRVRKNGPRTCLSRGARSP